jgi:thiamine-monophosphate kinase
MKEIEEIVENAVINSMVAAFRRTPRQSNKAHESDAELIEFPGDPHKLLAVTIDTLSEEIAEGIYRDPYTMGWVTANANLSDLAAVGAEPIGLVISASIEPYRSKHFSLEIMKGIEEACRGLDVFVLGGDTNTAQALSLTACAVGWTTRDKVLTRKGLEPGDTIFMTGCMGVGNALGLARITGMPEDAFPESSYRPTARLNEGLFLRDHACCCMDTSDGLLTTLDQLMRINGIGFNVDCDWETILSPEVLAFCKKTGMPQWLMAGGPHGEFELVFAVRANSVKGFIRESQTAGMNTIRLGITEEASAITLMLPPGRRVEVDMAALRNLLFSTEGDFHRLVQEFRSLGKKWGLE